MPKLTTAWPVNDYLDSIEESLGSSDRHRQRRLLAMLGVMARAVSFAELARQLPDPPKQIAHDVFDLAERRLVQMEATDAETTRVEITDAGKRELASS